MRSQLIAELRWLSRGRVLAVSFVFIPKTTKAGRVPNIINAGMVSLLQGLRPSCWLSKVGPRNNSLARDVRSSWHWSGRCGDAANRQARAPRSKHEKRCVDCFEAPPPCGDRKRGSHDRGAPRGGNTTCSMVSRYHWSRIEPGQRLRAQMLAPLEFPAQLGGAVASKMVERGAQRRGNDARPHRQPGHLQIGGNLGRRFGSCATDNQARRRKNTGDGSE